MVVGSADVAVEPLLARLTFATTVAPIVEGEDVQPQTNELCEDVDAGREVAVVAVTVEHRAPPNSYEKDFSS